MALIDSFVALASDGIVAAVPFAANAFAFDYCDCAFDLDRLHRLRMHSFADQLAVHNYLCCSCTFAMSFAATYCSVNRRNCLNCVPFAVMAVAVAALCIDPFDVTLFVALLASQTRQTLRQTTVYGMPKCPTNEHKK